MNALFRFKLGLLICATISVCLGMTLSSGLQRFRGGGSQLAGLMPPPADTSAKPASKEPPPPIPDRQAVRPAPARLLPIRWTSAVQLRDLSELARPEPLLNRPLNLPSRADKLTMVSARQPGQHGQPGQPVRAAVRNIEIVAKTCGDYLRLKGQGYGPKTDTDKALESSAKAQVYPLLYLHRAAPARQSFLMNSGNFDITANPLADLPASLAPVPPFSRTTEGRRDGSSRNTHDGASRRPTDNLAPATTWKKAFPAARAIADGKFSVRIIDKSYDARLVTLAWADFNNDGIEDVLVWISSTVRTPAGTHRTDAFAILTRLKQDGPLIVVDVRE